MIRGGGVGVGLRFRPNVAFAPRREWPFSVPAGRTGRGGLAAPRESSYNDPEARVARWIGINREKKFTMPYEFTGIVKMLKPKQSFASGFEKREVVVTSEGERYPQDVAFEFVKDRMGLLDSVKEGDRVKISFDIRGREYNGRHFVSLNGWKLEKPDAAGAEGVAPEPVPVNPMDVDVGDMPF